MDFKNKLSALRKKMANADLSAWLQPLHDEYMNEYPPASNRRLEWLTGFTGSAGMAVVTAEKAALFVDGRYVLQAKAQVDAALFQQHNIEDTRPEQWLAGELRTGESVGYDPRLTTRDMLKRLEPALQKKVIILKPSDNPIDGLWRHRPPAPCSPVVLHAHKYSGEAAEKKRTRIAKAIQEIGADAAVITAPDSVCWLLNVRGHDVEHTPFVLAPLIIDGAGRVQWFIDASRCDVAVKKHLGAEVNLCPPSTLERALHSLGAASASVLCDPQALPVWYTQHLSGAKIIERRDPCALPKAMKNPVELQGIRNAHVRDGAAVTKLLCWLDKETARRQVTEIEVGDTLLALRAGHPRFVEPSFHTIAGSGPHGAIVHYRATETSNRALRKGELLLLDSGGQYPDGTTDITRTVPIGKPSKEHKDRFTRVLKGHIAIATAQFPEGTSGSQLDVLARQYLWQAGLDYGHGTGHGVGHYLCVHEGPQRISKRGGDAALRPGMVVSNEPGYYKPGAYGIRIESLVAVIKKSPLPRAGEGNRGKAAAGEGGYLGFETLTCAPIDTRLVDKTLLTRQEKQWLNRYHAWVYKQLAGKLDAREKAWLKARCKAI